jgi:NADH:ubiquinone oxidoreductase subunit 4 (subunit M)
MEAKLAPYRKRFGEATKRENAELEAPDAREKRALVPLVVMAIVMGVAPMLFLRLSEKSVNSVRQSVVGTGEKSVSSVR